MDYFIKESSLTISFSDVTYSGSLSPSYCSYSDITWAISVSPAATFITLDATARTAVIYSTDVADVGTYVVTLTASIPTAAAASAFSVKTLTQTVTLSVKKCVDTTEVVTLTDPDTAAPAAYDLFLNEVGTTIYFDALTYDATATAHCDATDIVYSFGTISKPASAPSSSFITPDLANKQVSFSMVTSSSYIGAYSITLTGAIALNSPNAGNTASIAQTFTLNVKSCTDTTGNIVLSDSSPGTPGATDYFISSGTATVTFPALSYSGTTNCAASDIVYTLTSTDSFLTAFDATTRTVSISSSSAADLGSHTVTVRGEISAASATGTKFVDRSFTLTIKQCSQSTSSYTLVDSDTSSPAATRDYFVI